MKLLRIYRRAITRVMNVIKKLDFTNIKASRGHNASINQLFMIKLVGKNGRTKLVCTSSIKKRDIVEISAGETIPFDGEIIEGFATVDESAITGESSFVMREAGGDLSKVTAGTKVICNTIRIKITSSIKLVRKKKYIEDCNINSNVKNINFEV